MAKIILQWIIPAAALLMFTVGGCRNDSETAALTAVPLSKQAAAAAQNSGVAASGDQVRLLASSPAYGAARVDAGFVNAWGIAINPNNGIVWISANHSGKSYVLDTAGTEKRAPVTVPAADSAGIGSPSGIVFNPTNGFVVPSTGAAAKFIFASEDGVISAWSSGASAFVTANRASDGAVYKGLAMATVDGRSFLYAANFKGNAVDVFDDHFQRVTTMPFHDGTIPDGFAPFNVQNLDGLLYVTYAKLLLPDSMDDQAGPGNGFINIFTPDGRLLSRFASSGALNSPWGLARLRGDGKHGLDGAILVGNFGDGTINVFSRNGKFRGALTDSAGTPIVVPGLWGLSFLPGQPDRHHGDDRVAMDSEGKRSALPHLFFTAGPNGEDDGLFGYIRLALRNGAKQEDRRHDDKGSDDGGMDRHD